MNRLYYVVRIIENKSMTNFCKKIYLSDVDYPMTHKEACTFLSKQTKYSWCRDQLEAK